MSQDAFCKSKDVFYKKLITRRMSFDKGTRCHHKQPANTSHSLFTFNANSFLRSLQPFALFGSVKIGKVVPAPRFILAA